MDYIDNVSDFQYNFKVKTPCDVQGEIARLKQEFPYLVIISQVSFLIWVQTVCKGYQQKTKVATSKERVNKVSKSFLLLISGLIFTILGQ